MRLQGLKSLYLYNTNVADAAVKEIAGLKNLSTLYLGSTQITDASIDELAHLRTLSQLVLGSSGASGDSVTPRRMPGMSEAILGVFGTAYAALLVWLVVRIVNTERDELVESLRLGAVAIAVIAIAGATALVRVFAPH